MASKSIFKTQSLEFEKKSVQLNSDAVQDKDKPLLWLLKGPFTMMIKENLQ